jgi:hypothetical protein
MLGVLARFCPIIVQVTPFKTPFGLVTPFITIPITHSCNHTYYCLHCYTITFLARSCLQSLIAWLHCWLLTLCVVGLQFFGSTRSSLANYWLLSSPAGSLTLCLRQLTHWLCLRRLAHWLTLLSEIPVLKWACADGIVSTLSHSSFLHCDGLVTGETSVVYETKEFVTTFQVTDVFVTTDTSIPLRGNGTIFGYPGSLLQYFIDFLHLYENYGFS